jgi:hypothetical protein
VYKLKKSLALIILMQLALTNLIALCSATTFRTQAATELYINPASYTAQRIGETFNVTVNIHNLDVSQKLIFAQFRVAYNDTLLQAVDVNEGPFLQQFTNTAQPPYTLFINYTEDNYRYGPNVLVGILLMPNSTPDGGVWTNHPYGDGTLATITFKALYRPLEPSPPASCLLNLTDTLLVGDIPQTYNVTEISHTATSATYYSQPIPLPTLSIQPSDYQATLLGETFNVSVNINNLDADWKMIFAQFRIQYDATLLSAINVYEGPFLQQFPNSAEAPYTLFINYIEDNYRYGPNVLIGILLNPNSTGQWSNYPYGNGTLATITFQAIGQPSYPQKSITSNLVLNNTLLVEDLNATDVGEIPHNLASASYEISPPTFSYEPTQPSAGEVTIFKVSEPENHAPLTYNWNFGDGTTMNTTQPTAAHAFPAAGEYNVALTCYLNGAEATGVETLNVVYYMPLDVTAEVGSLHFKGETAEFTILTTDSGKPVKATSLEAKLYFNGTLINDLSSAVQTVDTGLYNVPYYIPADASAGEYTMLVKAEYYGASGAAIAKFTISPTLTAWNDSVVQITEIQDGVATISNGMTNLTLNLTAINATLTGLQNSNGQVLAKIDTTAGTLTTKLDTINAKIGEVNGNNVTISSTLGNITTELDGIQSTATTTLYVASIISAIAVILALAILIYVRKK